MITGVAGSTGAPTFSAELVSGQDFVFPGKTVNFANLVPNGVTVLITTSPNFVGGAGEFLIAQPFTFSAIAIGGNQTRIASERSARKTQSKNAGGKNMKESPRTFRFIQVNSSL